MADRIELPLRSPWPFIKKSPSPAKQINLTVGMKPFHRHCRRHAITHRPGGWRDKLAVAPKTKSLTTFRAPARILPTAHLSMNAATGGTCLATAGGLRYPNPPRRSSHSVHPERDHGQGLVRHPRHRHDAQSGGARLHADSRLPRCRRDQARGASRAATSRG